MELAAQKGVPSNQLNEEASGFRRLCESLYYSKDKNYYEANVVVVHVSQRRTGANVTDCRGGPLQLPIAPLCGGRTSVGTS